MPKLQKCWTYKIAIKIIEKMLKQPNFFYSQPFTLLKGTPPKFNLSTTFGLSFMISYVAHTQSSTFTYILSIKQGSLLSPVASHRNKDECCDLNFERP